MNFKNIIFIISLLLLGVSLQAQRPPSTEDEFEKAYNKRIQKDYLFGVYIPKDLTDAFVQLNRLIDKEGQAAFKTMGEADAVRKLHFSFGRWMIYNWGFYEGSRFSHYLKGLGIFNPDDMSRFVMLSYHRNLNRKPLNVKEQITQIQEMRKQERDKKLKGGEILHEEKRTRPRQ